MSKSNVRAALMRRTKEELVDEILTRWDREEKDVQYVVVPGGYTIQDGYDEGLAYESRVPSPQDIDGEALAYMMDVSNYGDYIDVCDVFAVTRVGELRRNTMFTFHEE